MGARKGGLSPKPSPRKKRSASGPRVLTRARRGAADDPIRHVVVLMLENRSFDQVLGCLQPELARDGIKLEGVDPAAKPRENFIRSGPPVQQLPLQPEHVRAALSMPDPMHELTNVKLQLGDGNSYFVLDYVITYPHTFPPERELIMRYYPAGGLPAIHELARHFTVCDHWFASVPGPTWTNRFFVHSGTSLGRVRMPLGLLDLKNIHFYDQDTIYDRLDERGIPWRIYYGDVPHSLVLAHQWSLKNKARYRSLDRFAADAQGPADAFPSYVFIEPAYQSDDANDDHPPHDVMRGQQLMADVYNALRANDELFQSALLVILYDEHGGFFDHVVPPAAVPPDEYDYEYDFKRLGVRVPAVLVSPWVDHAVVSTHFDHTSLLKYLADKWGLGPLGARTAQANSFAAAIRTSGAPRTGLPTVLSAPPATRERGVAPRPAAGGPVPLNDHQRGLLVFAEHLDAAPSRRQRAIPVRGARTPAREPEAARLAKQRVGRFLKTRAQPWR